MSFHLRSQLRRLASLEAGSSSVTYLVFETEAQAGAFLENEARQNITRPPGRLIVVDGVPEAEGATS